MSSFAIQSVMSTSGSSSARSSSSVLMASVGGEDGLREKSRTGMWRERGLSVRGLRVGGFCAEVEGGR